MSTFVSIFVQDISGRTQLPTANQQRPQRLTSSSTSETKQRLQNALLELDPPATEQSILAALVLLRDAIAPPGDPEEELLKQAILGRVVLGVYADALHTYLEQATEAETEAEWWNNIERSNSELAWYLLQSMSSRFSSSNGSEPQSSSPTQVIGPISNRCECPSRTPHPNDPLLVQASFPTPGFADVCR